MSGPNDVDKLLRDWDDVASTAKPPAQDPRRSVRSSTALPVSMVLVAVVAVGAIAVIGRGMPGPAPAGSPQASLETAASTQPDPSTEPASEAPSPVDAALSNGGGAEDGRFRIELTADQLTYQEGETIRADAAVTFLGPEDSIEVGHGSPPVTFVVEEIGGTRSVGGGMETVCLRSTFARDEAVPFPWERSGGYSTSNPGPNDLFAMEYLRDWDGAGDGQLRLPVGTWRLSTSLDVAEGDCGPTEPLTASVIIRVDPATVNASEPPTTPEPTPRGTYSPPTRAELLVTGPVVRCDRVGADGCEAAIALVADHAPAAYEAAAIIVVSDTCTPGAVCDRMYPFDATVLLVPAGGDAARSPSFAVHGQDGPEFVGEEPGFVGGWIPALVDEASALVAIPVGDPSGPGPEPCLEALGGGTLAVDDRFGLVFAYDNGSRLDVVWPFGFARDDASGPALVDSTGSVVAVVGDEVTTGGGEVARRVWVACPDTIEVAER